MGLIIKNHIRKFIAGFPTVSDKYNVAGGILTGDAAAQFGGAVKYTDTTGYYEAINADNPITAVTEYAGLVLGTNVKLAEGFATNVVQVNPQEAFNLLLDGYVAVKLAAGAVANEIVPNGAVYITGAGELTTVNGTGALGALDGYVFTGEVEDAADGRKVVEIRIK